MEPTSALLLVECKCNKPALEPEWEQWYDDEHLPELLEGSGCSVATRWVLSPKPPPGMPGLGYSHVTIYEFAGDALANIARLLERDADLRAADRIHPTHAVVGATTYVAHGAWATKPEPSTELRGHIVAQVFSNDPRAEAAWDAWYDDEHVPDMLASDAFAAATRWRRMPARPYAPTHLTLYDVSLPAIDEAVARSAAVMPGIVAAGRKHPAHTGALTLTLVPAGRYGGTGYRPT